MNRFNLTPPTDDAPDEPACELTISFYAKKPHAAPGDPMHFTRKDATYLSGLITGTLMVASDAAGAEPRNPDNPLGKITQIAMSIDKPQPDDDPADEGV